MPWATFADRAHRARDDDHRLPSGAAARERGRVVAPSPDARADAPRAAPRRTRAPRPRARSRTRRRRARSPPTFARSRRTARSRRAYGAPLAPVMPTTSLLGGRDRTDHRGTSARTIDADAEREVLPAHPDEAGCTRRSARTRRATGSRPCCARGTRRRRGRRRRAPRRRAGGPSRTRGGSRRAGQRVGRKNSSVTKTPPGIITRRELARAPCRDRRRCGCRSRTPPRRWTRPRTGERARRRRRSRRAGPCARPRSSIGSEKSQARSRSSGRRAGEHAR